MKRFLLTASLVVLMHSLTLGAEPQTPAGKAAQRISAALPCGPRIPRQGENQFPDDHGQKRFGRIDRGQFTPEANSRWGASPDADSRCGPELQHPVDS